MANTAKTPGGILGAPRKIASVLKEKRGLSASLPEVLGAVGISILLLGLVGFGIGAGITFAQDSGAKSTLEAVKSAQLLHQSKNNAFTDKIADLNAGNPPALAGDVTNVTLKVSTDKRHYCAVIESTSMSHTKFYITSKDGKITEGAPPTGLPTGLTCP